MSALQEFHFLRPVWLGLLVPYLFLAWRLWRHDPGRGYWQKICDPALIPFVVIDAAGRQRRRNLLPFALGGLLAILALAGPTYERAPQPVFRDQSALVVLLDLSTSMRATDITPSRLDRARFKIKDLLEGRTIGQTALVVFAAQPFVVTPLTDDVQTIESQLAVLTPELMPSQGSDVPRAVAKGIDLLRQAGFAHGDLLLITDSLPSAALDATLATTRGTLYRLSVLGVATPAGSPIPLAEGGFVTDATGGIVLSKLSADSLGDLARRGGGLYQPTSSNGADVAALQAFFAQSTRAADASATDRQASQWRELGPWLLLPVVGCAALAFRSGALALVLLALGAGAARPVAADWFATPDQAGRRAFEAERYAEAADRFARDDWRAASQYRAGRFEDTLTTLKHAQTPDGLYNRGNALARLGRFEDAIKTYDQVLKTTPTHADAAYNRELLRKLIEQQKPPEEQQQDEAQKDQDENQGGDGRNDQADAGDQGEQPADETGEDSQLKPPSPNEDPAETSEREKGKREQNASSTASPNAAAAPQDEPPEPGEAQESKGRDDAEQDPEKALATEQWLRQIPDDPGGLLRRKFLYQYGRLHRDEPAQAEPW